MLELSSYLRLFSSDAFFYVRLRTFTYVYVRLRTFTYVYVRLRTYAQYASLNEFTCSEHSVRIRRSKKRSTENQPLE